LAWLAGAERRGVAKPAQAQEEDVGRARSEPGGLG
jgi:hypothetical protein